jgi:hypothetical protein
MHVVVGHVRIDPQRGDEAKELLDSLVIPTVKANAGFVRGNWARSLDGTRGTSFVVYDTAEHAQAAIDNAPTPPEGAPAQFESAAVYELLGEA